MVKGCLKSASVSERPFRQRGGKLILPSSVTEGSWGAPSLAEEAMNNETLGAGKE